MAWADLTIRNTDGIILKKLQQTFLELALLILVHNLEIIKKTIIHNPITPAISSQNLGRLSII